MVVHIINMSPSRPLGLQIPQELWTDSKPNYDKLRIFGCESYALTPKDDRWKLEPRSRKCVLLGYGWDGEIGYRVWDPEHRQIVWILDVVFNESAMHKTTEKPIQVRRVIFSEVPTPSRGPNSQYEIGFTGNRKLPHQINQFGTPEWLGLRRSDTRCD